MSETVGRAVGGVDQESLEKRYHAARARLESSQRIEQGQSGALMFAAMAYGETLESKPMFATMSHLAKLFCIAALFLIPNLLVIYVLL